MKKRTWFGFTLIELLITLAITGLIAMIAFPSYVNHITKSRRAAAEALLTELSQRMERYFSTNNTYVGATIDNVGATASVVNDYYVLQISATGATSFTIQAVPQGNQEERDDKCGTLSLNQLGIQSISGTGSVDDCW